MHTSEQNWLQRYEEGHCEEPCWHGQNRPKFNAALDECTIVSQSVVNFRALGVGQQHVGLQNITRLHWWISGFIFWGQGKLVLRLLKCFRYSSFPAPVSFSVTEFLPAILKTVAQPYSYIENSKAWIYTDTDHKILRCQWSYLGMSLISFWLSPCV